LLLRDFQAFFTPDTLNPLVINVPAFNTQKCRNPTITIPTILQGQTQNIRPQNLFVMALTPSIANNITVYIKSTARAALRYIISLLRMDNALALALRA